MATGDGRRGGRVGELKVELVLVVPLRKKNQEGTCAGALGQGKKNRGSLGLGVVITSLETRRNCGGRWRTPARNFFGLAALGSRVSGGKHGAGGGLSIEGFGVARGARREEIAAGQPRPEISTGG